MTLFTLFFTYMFHKTLVNIKNYLMLEKNNFEKKKKKFSKFFWCRSDIDLN